MEHIREIIRSNGVKYSVRRDRNRFFFPDEWQRFIKQVKEEKRLIFDVLIGTGARIDEALHIKPCNIDQDRNTLILYVTKVKAKKGEKIGKPRTMIISSELIKRIKKYAKEHNIQENDYLFKRTNQGTWELMRTALKKSGIKDFDNFGLHNIRKTHGNWLKSLEVPAEEICLRLGHDYNTYLKHYGSPNIFDRSDKQRMVQILGDIYGLK